MRGLLCVVFVLASASAFAQPEPTPGSGAEAPPVEPPKPEPKPEPPKVEPPKAEPTREPAKPIDEKPLVISEPQGYFQFGSYGRIIAGTDLRGGKPESANVVAHGPRIVEPSYLELDFSYEFNRTKIKPIITLAFDGTLFHDTGDFDAQPALRNMYLNAPLTKQLTGWVGSRMYRGDDIYLFDYWPLDDQNTVGGGLIYRRTESEDGRSGDTLEVAAHAGVNRLLNNFQFQEVPVADSAQGETTIVQLNRQRMVLSSTVSYILAGDRTSIKGKLHGEVHALPSGTRKRETDGSFEDLPSDSGFVLGIELGAFGFHGDAPRHDFRRHINVFMRYSKGLAAFDELAPPTSFGFDRTTSRASELSFGLSGNWDTDFGHLMAGALSRRFIDSDAPGSDYDDGWEYALDVRPLVRPLKSDVPEFFVGADISYQARFPRGLSPKTLRAEDPSVFQIAPMLVWSPQGPSGYDRPQLRVVYRAAFLNEGARDLYEPADPRHDDKVTHFLGFQAEWWFNSTTYR